MNTVLTFADLIADMLEDDVINPDMVTVDKVVDKLLDTLRIAPILWSLIEYQGDTTATRRRFNCTDGELHDTLRPMLLDMYWDLR